MKSVTLPPEPPRPARTVLIVEANDDLRELYGYWLRLNGFDVLLAPDGTVALQSLETCTPDVLVLDLHLKTLDGASVLQSIAENARTCHIPVIVVDQEHLLSAVNAALPAGLTSDS
jgi:DNA-binding response OmpR family regulator